MAERDRKMVKHIFEMKENYNKFRQLFRQQAEDLLKKLDKHGSLTVEYQEKYLQVL